MKTINTLNKVAGREVEITVRGEKSFTFSFDAIDKKATEAIKNFFIGQATITGVEEDEECGTFIYCELFA